MSSIDIINSKANRRSERAPFFSRMSTNTNGSNNAVTNYQWTQKLAG